MQRHEHKHQDPGDDHGAGGDAFAAGAASGGGERVALGAGGLVAHRDDDAVDEVAHEQRQQSKLGDINQRIGGERVAVGVKRFAAVACEDHQVGQDMRDQKPDQQQPREAHHHFAADVR